MNLDLRDKIAVVTGGSRGIGRCTVQKFAEEGCHVAFCARGDEDLQRAASELRALGVQVFAFQGDITQPEAAKQFIDETAKTLGGIDVLVNNVGGSAGGTKAFADTTDEDWQETYNLNTFHAVRTTRLALPYFQKRGGGSVIIISSISGWLPGGHPQYGTAKAAEIFLARELALALAEHNIRVNAVCPGSIIWPGGGWDHFRQSNPQAFADFESHEFPGGRLGRPEEIADVVVFLSSARAHWINGALIPVDGAQRRSSVDRKDR